MIYHQKLTKLIIKYSFLGYEGKITLSQEQQKRADSVSKALAAYSTTVSSFDSAN